MNKNDYNHIVQTISHRVYAFMLKSCGNEELAKDITQDAFLKLWENHDKVDPEKARSWLFTTAHRLFLNSIKKNQHHTNYTNENHVQFEHQNFENKDLINQCFKELSDQQKQIVLLRDLEGYNYDEIGEILQLSASQVKVYLFRARKKFKEAMMKLESDASPQHLIQKAI